MNEILKFILCVVVLVLYGLFLYYLFQIIEIIDLRKKIKAYNKRFNANLDTSFSDLKRLRVQYSDWYVSMFVPDEEIKMSHWECLCAYEESGEYEK